MIEDLTPSDMNFFTTDKVYAAYILTHCKTGRKYIGSSGKVGTRLSEHKSKLLKNKHYNESFQKDYNASPEYDIVVYTVQDRAAAYKLEQALIDKYWPSGILYNKTPNAEKPMLNRVVGEEERARVGRMNRGKKFSPEWCAKISESLTGKVWTEQQRERFIKNRTGIPFKEEHRELYSSVKDNEKKYIYGEGNIYHGLWAAAKEIGCTKAHIRHRIRSHLPQWSQWYYVESPHHD